jgi:hypothetical protein
MTSLESTLAHLQRTGPDAALFMGFALGVVLGSVALVKISEWCVRVVRRTLNR